MTTLHRDRVLLVDDEPQVLLALEDLLSDKFSVLTTTSADDALRVLAEQGDIAVVVTDQRMPNMTGDQLLAKLGPSCRALRILVTGFADLNSVIRAVNEGSIFAYVTKPWDADDLRDKVDQAAQRFRSAKELVNERQLLHDLLRHSPDGIYLKDRQLRFIQANPAFAAQNRCAAEVQLLGKRLSELIQERALAERIEAEEQHMLESGQPVLDVLREYSDGANRRWYSETRAPIRGNSGAVVGLLGISRDVTERVRDQSALAESEARLRSQTQLLNAILESLAEGVMVADERGQFLLFNRQARRILGFGPDGLQARSWALACGAYQLDRKTPLSADDDPLNRAMAGEPWSEVEIFVRNSSVAGSHVVLTGTPLVGVDGGVVGGIALLRDVSVHKALEQRLAQAHKLEAVGRLAGGIAHDFNNLLSVIQSCTGLLLRKISEGEEHDDLSLVLAAAERAANLTKQLMLFSRQQIPQPEVLQVNELVTQLTGMLGRVLGEDVNFTTQLEPALLPIKADRSQVEQIFVNLTVNARDAMPSGGELRIATRNVRVTESELAGTAGVAAGDFVVLTVADNGVGMDAQTQSRMYEPFYTTKDVGKGTGLGLATVYGIVRQGGGFVSCTSQLGRGTTFDVYLPATRNLTRAPQADRNSEQSPALAAGTIMLVEDEDAVRLVAARMLRMQGYRVLEARRPSEAKRIYAEHFKEIDLVVTDIVMPEMSGTQLVAALCNITPGMRVLYMSGYAGASAPLGEEARPNTWFLEKPFTAKSLVAKVAEALEPKVN